MQVREVKDKQTRKLFHQVAHEVYRGDENWAPPLEVMIDNTFDPEKNAFYKNGDGTRWVLTDDDGRLLGRVGAFINGNKAYTFQQPTGGMGYFECVEDQEAAFLLFETAKDWLKERGMEAMDGPVNFGENLMNWGLLVDGFQPQAFGMPYHKTYYRDFFEAYGFKVYFEQYSYHLNHKDPFPERFWKIAGWVAQKPNFHFEHVRFSKIEKYIQDFVKIYDQAWARHDNHQSVDLDDIRGMVRLAKFIADEEFLWFAYHNDEPVAFFGMIPDWNQILAKLDGKVNLKNVLKFWYYKRKKTITRTRILIMGVVPKFQGSGLESAIFWHLDKVMKRKHWYNEIEMSWVGDFNPKMVAMYKSVGGVHAKTHYTMRYLFDPNQPFERAPKLMKDVRLLREERKNKEKSNTTETEKED